MKSRTMKVALAVTAFLLMCGAGYAQNPWWWHNGNGNQGYQDRDRDGRDDRYERGLRDGRGDREHHRAWHPRDGNAAYMNGYRAGFGYNAGVQGRRDPNYRGPYNNGPYNNGPYNNGPSGNVPGNQSANRVAYNNGYQSGLSYGQGDRGKGKRYEPTGSGVYQDGDRGYSSYYGDKSLYKSSFRQGYLAGYQRGYYGR